MVALGNRISMCFLGISEKGQVGDFINGISTPILTILMTYLLYKSFIMQYEANVIQKNAILKLNQESEARKSSEWIMKIFDEMKNELEKMTYERYSDNRWVKYQGIKAIQ